MENPVSESSENCSRSLENVVATLKLSKLNVDDVATPYQTVYFSPDASDQDYTLIQLNKEVLDHLTKGGDLIIRGNEGDSAVLCTDDQTYDVKKAHTSNTLLALPECTIMGKGYKGSDENETVIGGELVYREIAGWSHDYIELKHIHPKVARIRKLLSENPYLGPEKDAENTEKKKYTLTELMDVIQGSEGEIASALFKTGCCCINGYWRILDFGYEVDCLGEICGVIDSESWSIERVPLEQLCEKVNDSGELVPEFIIRHLVAYYGTPITEDATDVTPGVTYKLNEEKLCRFFAEMLLKDVGKFNLAEFLDVWKQSVPEGIEPKQEYLHGLALIRNDTRPPTIQYFSVATLPQNASERFEVLFSTKTKWTKDEIVPYIEDLCLDGQAPSALLTKFARGSIQGETKMYCSRKTPNS